MDPKNIPSFSHYVCVATNTLPLLTASMSAAFALVYFECMPQEMAFF